MKRVRSVPNDINNGFLKTKKSFSQRFVEVFSGRIDDELYEDLTETLVLSDIPYKTAQLVIDGAKERLSRKNITNEEAVRAAVADSAYDIIKKCACFEGIKKPAVILVMGVNGVGKTTTIAKLANLYKNEGNSVMLAACDTFRAAASEQLSIWAEKIHIPIVKSMTGQDASGVLFDAITSAKAKKTDVLICDTAGRLQNKKNLMDELEKIYRVAEKKREEMNLYSLLVLDAMTGLNSMNQISEFSQIREPDGIVLTKTDGSAKGGVLIALASEKKVPIWYVGTGEGIDDIAVFEPKAYIDAILG